jgi:hypothetical protein
MIPNTMSLPLPFFPCITSAPLSGSVGHQAILFSPSSRICQGQTHFDKSTGLTGKQQAVIVQREAALEIF